MPSSKDNPLQIASGVAAAIAMHEGVLLHNRMAKEIPDAHLPMKCFRAGCNAQRTHTKLFCSVSCSKLHDEMQRAVYHEKGKSFLKKPDLIICDDPVKTILPKITF